MRLVRLTPDTELVGFDCGDDDLNSFLVEDAKSFLDKRIATSYLLVDGDNIVAYFVFKTTKSADRMLPTVNGRKSGADSRNANSSAVTRLSRSEDLLFHQNTEVGISALT